jgi:hypothetical protein
MRHGAVVEDHREAGIGQEEEQQEEAAESQHMFISESHEGNIAQRLCQSVLNCGNVIAGPKEPLFHEGE